MTDRELMQQALEKLEFFSHMKSVSEDTMRLITDLKAALAEQLTDEQISDLWHQSGEQPFKFARMLVK